MQGMLSPAMMLIKLALLSYRRNRFIMCLQ
jgi:hypothetical protein